VIGTGFDDLMRGDAGNNRFDGGDGNDTMSGRGGDDFFVGGAGQDVVTYSGATVAIAANLGLTTAQNTNEGNDRFLDIEDLGGSDFNDTLTGSALDNQMGGCAGNDLISGVGGDDFLFGDVGDDTLLGGAGADTLGGFDGTDAASYANATAGVFASLISGGLAGEALGDVFTSIERLIGSNHNDTFQGATGAERLDGGLGADLMNGDDGNDTLSGGDGADTLIGGRGTDRLLGGTGADRFTFANEDVGLNAARDLIQDWATGDRISLFSGFDADVDVAGVQVFTFIGTAAFSAVGQLRYVVVGGLTIVEMNTSAGNGNAADGQIGLSGIHTLTAGDFLLV